mgnify:CR=1 FL=1
MGVAYDPIRLFNTAQSAKEKYVGVISVFALIKYLQKMEVHI